jgi:hypothetical protein
MRPTLSLAAGLVMVAAACGGGDQVDQMRFGPVPHCADQPIARTLLVAQSVPTAELVPCYDELPIGLELKHVEVNSAGSEFTFDIDRYDEPVWMRFAEACDVDEVTTSVQSAEGIERFEGRSARGLLVEGTRFTGGCVTFEFGGHSLAETAEAQALVRAVRFVSRAELAEYADWQLGEPASRSGD